MLAINPEALERITCGDQDLLADLAMLFVQLLPDIECRLRVGIENHDADAIGMVVHQLCSRFSYLGALELQQLSNDIETAAKQGDFVMAGKLFEAMLNGVDQLLVELRQLTRLSLDVVDD